MIIRIAIILCLLWGVAHYRPSYRQAHIAKVVSGIDLCEPRPGIVTFNGHVLKTYLTAQGGEVFKLSVDSQEITVYVGPTVNIIVPDIGSYVEVTGKMLGAKAVNVEDHHNIKVKLLPPTSYTVRSEPGNINERVEFPVTDVTVLARKNGKGDLTYLRITLASTKETTVLVGTLGIDSDLTKAHSMRGYTLPNGYFLVEGWN